MIIEHLEEKLGKWIKLEYSHSLDLAEGCLLVTNAGRDCSEIARVVGQERCVKESVEELIRRGLLDARGVVVLDPRAEKLLEPGDASWTEYIVVGGILGDHPPRGRTWGLLTSRLFSLGVEARSLGEAQFSIDGAVYMALKVLAEGQRLDEIPVIQSPRIELSDAYGFTWEVELPFAYPVMDGRPLFAPGLEELIRSGLGYEEALLGRDGGDDEAEEDAGKHGD